MRAIARSLVLLSVLLSALAASPAWAQSPADTAPVKAVASTPPENGRPLDATLRMLDLFGDLRLREEIDPKHQDAQGGEQPFRQRPRLRLRLGLALTPTQELTLVARFVTGSPTDPKSPHETFGQANAKLVASFGEIFLAYRPAWAPGFEVAAGKISHPFTGSAVYSELVFDGDVQPTGASVTYHAPALGPVAVFAAAGEYLLLEQGQNADIHMTVAQLGTDIAAAKHLRLRAVAETYWYWNPTTGGATALLDQNRGNLTRDDDGDGEADGFASDFHLVNAFGEVHYTGLALPLVATGGILHNLGAVRSAQATGWFAGLAVGRTKDAYDFRVYGQYQSIPRESVFSPYSQDDFAAATAFDGIVAGVTFLPLSWLNLNLWALTMRPELQDGGRGSATGSWQARLRLDLNAKF